jgi:hypothetical protein
MNGLNGFHLDLTSDFQEIGVPPMGWSCGRIGISMMILRAGKKSFQETKKGRQDKKRRAGL